MTAHDQPMELTTDAAPRLPDTDGGPVGESRSVSELPEAHEVAVTIGGSADLSPDEIAVLERCIKIVRDFYGANHIALAIEQEFGVKFPRG